MLAATTGKTAVTAWVLQVCQALRSKHWIHSNSTNPHDKVKYTSILQKENQGAERLCNSTSITQLITALAGI